MTTIHWSEVFGNDTTALDVVRLYKAAIGGLGGLPLAGWLEQESAALWGDDHVAHDWSALASQIAADALHGDYTLEDVANGLAQVVSCPDCGQLEIWGVAEIADHGVCRSNGKG